MTMTRGTLAKRTGCHLETVRYYEQTGLMPDPPRSAAGHRRYGADHERRLRFILRGRELGFTIDELRTLLGLVDRRQVTCGQIRTAALAHLDDVRRKIADLRRMERTLAATAARCQGGRVPDCPIIETLSGPN
ncbi:MAG: helix-turn-helix domain-containing protein [Acidobacteriota bacterium]